MMKKPTKKTDLRFAFFGTPELATTVLDELEHAGYVPALVVTTPDKRQGRGLQVVPTPVKTWAKKREIEVMQPEVFNASEVEMLSAQRFDVFVVIYYGKILPRAVLDIPKRGVLNIHFSLLPRLRGTSPVRSAILKDESDTGTSIILLDEEIDHGPLVAQKKISVADWPPRASDFERLLTKESATLLINILPSWIRGEIDARPQNHDLATYCLDVEKKDGLLNLSADGYKNLLKIKAFDTTVGTYTFFERNGKHIRVGVLDAHLIQQNDLLGKKNGKLVINRVKPEGKREMDYEEFLRSGAKPITPVQNA